MSKGSNSHFDAIVERERGLTRSLSAGQMSMIAIGGAIGTGLFLGSGFAVSMAGPSVLISYAIGALISLLLMGCLVEMTLAHPTTGSFGAYAEYYVSPWAGFMVRYAYWTCCVLGIGTEVTAIAVYMKYWLPDVPGWFWLASFSSMLVIINAFSVKVFGTVEYWLSLLKVSAIVGFIILGGYVLFGQPTLVARDGIPPASLMHYVDHGGFFPHGFWGMWVAVIISIFSYIGIEMIAVAAGEAEHPDRAITVAFRSTVARLVIFYLGTLSVMLAVVPWNQITQGTSPFVRVMEATHIPGAAGLINFVVLVATLSAVNSQLYITARMMFSLSRAGHAPRALGTVSRHGVPVAALLLSTVGVGIATVLSIIIPATSFAVMIGVSIFGALFTWLMIFVTHYRFRRAWDASGRPPLAFRMWGFPWLTGLGALLILAVLLSTLMTDAFRITLYFGMPYLLLLSILYFVRYRRAPREALSS
jgi:L-asparagine transporter-like permease